MRSLEDIADEIRACRRCPLWTHRTNAVPGEGNPNAEIMFIGEAPGRNEDLQGRPFVGAAGKLLTELLSSIGLTRDEVYITNVIKCRPPNNRDPKKEEIETCSQYLDEQIALIKPKIIVTLGRHSTRYILEKAGYKVKSIMAIRGKVHEVVLGDLRVKVLPTLHPAAALYNPALRSLLEKDFQLLMSLAKKKALGQVSLDEYL